MKFGKGDVRIDDDSSDGGREGCCSVVVKVNLHWDTCTIAVVHLFLLFACLFVVFTLGVLWFLLLVVWNLVCILDRLAVVVVVIKSVNDIPSWFTGEGLGAQISV